MKITYAMERTVYRLLWEDSETEDSVFDALGKYRQAKPTSPRTFHEQAEAAVWDLADGRDMEGLFWRTKEGAQAACAQANRELAQGLPAQDR